jgi:hypothetical protein
MKLPDIFKPHCDITQSLRCTQPRELAHLCSRCNLAEAEVMDKGNYVATLRNQPGGTILWTVRLVRPIESVVQSQLMRSDNQGPVVARVAAGIREVLKTS